MNPDPIYKNIGAIISRRRKSLKMTQERLSKKLGISRGALANIETGRQNILVHQLYSYAAVLGLEIFELLPPPKIAVPKAELSDLPIPSNVNRSQAEQIARLLLDRSVKKKPLEESRNGKTNRR